MEDKPAVKNKYETNLGKIECDDLRCIIHDFRLPPRSGPLKMGPIVCPKILVRNYHYLLCNNPEECSSHKLYYVIQYIDQQLYIIKFNIVLYYVHLLVNILNIRRCTV